MTISRHHHRHHQSSLSLLLLLLDMSHYCWPYIYIGVDVPSWPINRLKHTWRCPDIWWLSRWQRLYSQPDSYCFLRWMISDNNRHSSYSVHSYSMVLVPANLEKWVMRERKNVCMYSRCKTIKPLRIQLIHDARCTHLGIKGASWMHMPKHQSFLTVRKSHVGYLFPSLTFIKTQNPLGYFGKVSYVKI